MRAPGSGPTTPPRLVLTTERLLLRGWKDEDGPALHALFSDPEVARYAGVEPHQSEAATRELVRGIVASRQQNPPPHGFVIVLRDEKQVVGHCRLSILRDGNGQGDIAYHLVRRFWGRGYASEASRALLGYGFDDFGLHRISARVRPANVASWRVLEKIGMRREGCLRRCVWDGRTAEWVDHYVYAILEDEWRTGRPLTDTADAARAE